GQDPLWKNPKEEHKRIQWEPSQRVRLYIVQRSRQGPEPRKQAKRRVTAQELHGSAFSKDGPPKLVQHSTATEQRRAVSTTAPPPRRCPCRLEARQEAEASLGLAGGNTGGISDVQLDPRKRPQVVRMSFM